MVFQERIPKERELRVAFVGGTCFVGALNSAQSSTGQVDWRLGRVFKLVYPSKNAIAKRCCEAQIALLV
jgi:hypothetical protein